MIIYDLKTTVITVNNCSNLGFTHRISNVHVVKSHCSDCSSDEETQLHRLCQRNSYSPDEAKARISSQMSLDAKCQKANYVINNNNGKDETKRQVEAIFTELQQSKAHWKVRLPLLAIVCMISYLLYIGCSSLFAKL